MNGLASTGPRTPTGKARSSRNATKHGLLSRELVLAGESHRHLDGLTERLTAQLQPQGELEALLVERVVGCVWRLRRLLVVEVALTERARWHQDYTTGEQEDLGASHAWAMHGGADRFVSLNRYEVALERSMYRALHELERAQASRRGELVSVPAVVDVTVNVDQGE